MDEVLVDPEFAHLLQLPCFINSGGYVTLKPSLKLLHRIIMDAKSGEIIDHINRNRLDNRRSNLRLVSASENQWNRGRAATNTSGFKGVRWDKSRNKWIVDYMRHGKTKHIGRFTSLDEAVEAYHTRVVLQP